MDYSPYLREHDRPCDKNGDRRRHGLLAEDSNSHRDHRPIRACSEPNLHSRLEANRSLEYPTTGNPDVPLVLRNSAPFDQLAELFEVFGRLMGDLFQFSRICSRNGYESFAVEHSQLVSPWFLAVLSPGPSGCRNLVRGCWTQLLLRTLRSASMQELRLRS